MPTMPITAFAAEAEVPPGGEAQAPLPWITWTPYTYPFNISGQPAVSVPCGLTPAGLPVGLQIVGPWAHDERVLAFASRCETGAWPHRGPSASRRGGRDMTGGAAHPVTTSDGVGLQAWSFGRGDPVLFVHEFTGDARSWAPQTGFFERHYRVVTTMRGAIRPPPSPRIPAFYSQARAAADLADVLDAFALPAPMSSACPWAASRRCISPAPIPIAYAP